MPNKQIKAQVKKFKLANQERIAATISEGNKLAQDWIAEGFNYPKIIMYVDVTRTDEWTSFCDSKYFAYYKTLFPGNENRYNSNAFKLFLDAFKSCDTFDSSKLIKSFDLKITQQCSHIDLMENLNSYTDDNTGEEIKSIDLNEHVKTPRSCQIM